MLTYSSVIISAIPSKTDSRGELSILRSYAIDDNHEPGDLLFRENASHKEIRIWEAAKAAWLTPPDFERSSFSLPIIRHARKLSRTSTDRINCVSLATNVRIEVRPFLGKFIRRHRAVLQTRKDLLKSETATELHAEKAAEAANDNLRIFRFNLLEDHDMKRAEEIFSNAEKLEQATQEYLSDPSVNEKVLEAAAILAHGISAPHVEGMIQCLDGQQNL
jgi:hypothetical protein